MHRQQDNLREMKKAETLDFTNVSACFSAGDERIEPQGKISKNPCKP
jgi:hypothetical protein